MKEKLLAELKKKYTGQLTVKYMEALAERLEPKVKDEKDIEGVINELENLPIKITDLQAEGDRRATDEQKRAQAQAAQLQTQIDELKKAKIDEPRPTGGGAYDLQINELKKQLTDLQHFTKKQTATSMLREVAGKKKIMSSLLEGVEIDDVSKVDEVIEKLEAKQTAIRQEFINTELGGEAPKKSTAKATNEQIRSDIEKYKIKKD
jgi:hypothetical protein